MKWIIAIVAMLMVMLLVKSVFSDNYLRKKSKSLKDVEQLFVDVKELQTQMASLTTQAVGFRKDSAKFRRNEIIRLTMIASEPLGSEDMIDMMGNEVIWNDAKLTSINEAIEEHQVRLEEMGLPRYVYEYTP